MPIKTDTSDGDGGGAPGGAPPAAGTITAMQTADTAVAYNCLGARAVVFMLAGADAHTLASVATKASNDGSHWFDVSGSGYAELAGPAITTALNGTPLSFLLSATVGGSNGTDVSIPLQFRYYKLTVTAGASDVAGFNSTATIIR